MTPAAGTLDPAVDSPAAIDAPPVSVEPGDGRPRRDAQSVALPLLRRRATTAARAGRAAALFTALLLTLVLVTAAAAAADLQRRLGRVSVAPTATTVVGDGTWLLVGSDSRASAPDRGGAFGTTAQVPGQRADVIVLVHRGRGRVTVLSVPRDVLLTSSTGYVGRAALAFADSPQALADGLCRTLRIAVGHTAVLTMSGLADLVDTVGGIRVTVGRPVRDQSSGLLLPHPGTSTLTAAQALAFVRSRHPEYRTATGWQPVSDTAGAAARSLDAGAVLNALAARLRTARHSPLVLWRAARGVASGLAVDHRTGLTDLAEIARALAGGPSEVATLPVTALPGTVAVAASPAAAGVVHAAGLDTGCAPAGA